MGKIPENLSKIPENPAKWRPTFAEKHIKTYFWRSYQKVTQKLFGQVWEIRAKILRTPKICLLLHLCAVGLFSVHLRQWLKVMLFKPPTNPLY